jgi:hypothetical protein
MVSVKDFDEQLARIERTGKSGDLPTTMSADAKIDEIDRTVSELRKAIELLIRHSRQGPNWDVTYRVSWEDVDSDNIVTVVHNLGYATADWLVIRVVSAAAISTALSYAYWPTLRMVGANDRDVRFQFSTEGVAQQMTYFVAATVRYEPPRGLA